MLQLMKPGFGTILPLDGLVHEQWVAMLMRRDRQIERWTCDLSTGLFTIGRHAQALHGLDAERCGLLDILRPYPISHHQMVLAILEEATAAPSSFCFCTTLENDDREPAPIFCVGSSEIGSKHPQMQGIFALPRLRR